jgi:hypothetical protein
MSKPKRLRELGVMYCANGQEWPRPHLERRAPGQLRGCSSPSGYCSKGAPTTPQWQRADRSVDENRQRLRGARVPRARELRPTSADRVQWRRRRGRSQRYPGRAGRPGRNRGLGRLRATRRKRRSGRNRRQVQRGPRAQPARRERRAHEARPGQPGLPEQTRARRWPSSPRASAPFAPTWSAFSVAPMASASAPVDECVHD